MLRSRVFIGVVVVVAVVLVALAVAQAVLPGLAADRIRSRLAHDGTVAGVEVKAFPAIKLLWGDADTVRVHMSSLRVSNRRAGDLLAQASGVSRLDLSSDTVSDGPLLLRAVGLHKQGKSLSGSAVVHQADLRAALPPGFDVAPVASGGGQLLLRAQAGLFGAGVTVDALLSASTGALVVTPQVPFGGLATLTVFSDPRVYVLGVDAATASGGWQFSVRARLRA